MRSDNATAAAAAVAAATTDGAELIDAQLRDALLLFLGADDSGNDTHKRLYTGPADGRGPTAGEGAVTAVVQ
jgi:hypothetical protein